MNSSKKILLCSVISFLTLPTLAQADTSNLYVQVAGLKARNSADGTSTICQLNMGESIAVLSAYQTLKPENWLKIQCPNQKTGYVQLRYLSHIEPNYLQLQNSYDQIPASYYTKRLGLVERLVQLSAIQNDLKFQDAALQRYLKLAQETKNQKLIEVSQQDLAIVTALQKNQRQKKTDDAIDKIINAQLIDPIVNGNTLKKVTSITALYQQLGKPTKIIKQGFDECNSRSFPDLLDYGSFKINKQSLAVQSMNFDTPQNTIMVLGKSVSKQTTEVDFLTRYLGLITRTAPHIYVFESESGLTQYQFEFKNYNLFNYSFFMDDC